MRGGLVAAHRSPMPSEGQRMQCEGCGTAMAADQSREDAAARDEPIKWKCPRCESWCLADAEGDVLMAAWLLEGREWPH